MEAKQILRLGLIIGGLIGLAVATALIAHFGWRQVVEAALAVGFQGLLALIAIYAVCLLLCALAWKRVLPEPPAHAFATCLWGRWLRESVGNLLALLPTAGEVAGTRELVYRGVRPAVAGASVVVDVTLELISQILFTLFGLALLLTWYQGKDIGPWLVTGIALSVLAAAGFILAQKKGLFRYLERLPETLDLKWAWTVAPETEGVQAVLRKIYADRAGILSGAALHLIAWVVGAGEAFVGLWLMGHPLVWSDALILESIAFALRTAAFVVPSRLGVQEGGYVLIGAMFGLTPEVALALSLLKRGREIATGVPCLIIWQAVEARRLLRRRESAKSAD